MVFLPDLVTFPEGVQPQGCEPEGVPAGGATVLVTEPVVIWTVVPARVVKLPAWKFRLIRNTPVVGRVRSQS